MARVKITNKTIQAKLTKWAQGQETTDELIYYLNEIDSSDAKKKAWEQAGMIINVLPDTVDGFHKIIYTENL